jgi:antitoxin FitA
MNKHVQIRNMDSALHRKLKIRAAENDMSLSDYLKKELARMAAKPTLAEMSERLKKLPAVKTSEETAEIIRSMRDGLDRN